MSRRRAADLDPEDPEVAADRKAHGLEKDGSYAGVVSFSSGMTLKLAAEGEPAEGARRFGCPGCGAKHDVTYPAGQTPGTWAVPFACLADCGHPAGDVPVTG